MTDSPSYAALSNRAVIYCRVSSSKQVTEGDGLGGQEVSCRRYATARGYEVVAVFTDGITGGTDERKGLLELLAFLESQPPGIVVVIDDIKRFARDVELHFGLKRTIMDRGARLESPLFRFEDTPEGKFIETMMAAQAELERNQNKRQVVSRMRARLEQGFWVFNAMPGYSYQRHPMAKKLLVPNEQASMIREALEGFASGRFATLAEVDRFLMSQGSYTTNLNFQGSRLTRVRTILSCVLYAGWIEYQPWGITLRKGQHESLISLETYTRIQERLQQRSTVRPELTKRNIYPLRGIARCEGCTCRLTASRSRGKVGKYYSYYHCPNSECRLYGKSIPAMKLEGDFEELLRPLELSDEQYGAVTAWLEHFSKEEGKSALQLRQQLTTQLVETEKRIQELIETISKASSEVVIKSLEARVEEMTRTKERIQARLHESASQPEISVGTLLDQVGHLLKNPLLVWQTGDIKMRHLLAQIAFSGVVSYCRETGFGTPDLSLPYRFFGTSENRNAVWWTLEESFSNLALEAKNANYNTLRNPCPSGVTYAVEEVIRELLRWSQLLRDYSSSGRTGAAPAARACTLPPPSRR